MRRILAAVATMLALSISFIVVDHPAHAQRAPTGCGDIRRKHMDDPANAANAIAAALCDAPVDQAGGAAFTYGYEIGSALLHTGCTRHFYNKSGFTWVIIPSPSLMQRHMCGYGTDADDTFTAAQRIESLCTATPATTFNLRYPSPASSKETEQITIMGYRANPPGSAGPPEENGIVFNETFDITPETFGECWSIKHSGNTGNIVVNDPGAGDISTCGYQSYKCDTAVKEPSPDDIHKAAYAACLKNGRNPNCHWICIDGTMVTTGTSACASHGGWSIYRDPLHRGG